MGFTVGADRQTALWPTQEPDADADVWGVQREFRLDIEQASSSTSAWFPDPPTWQTLEGDDLYIPSRDPRDWGPYDVPRPSPPGTLERRERPLDSSSDVHHWDVVSVWDEVGCPHPGDVVDNDVDVESTRYQSALGEFHVVATPVGGANPEQEQLVVLLHGAGGTPGGVTNVLSAFALAGFRAVALDWRAPRTARQTCGGELDFDLYNQCLVADREDKLWNPTYGIVPQLTDLLNQLALDDSGWARFITGSGEPGWSQIILAGYSEGANETGYAIRQLPMHGAILISGGGDVRMAIPAAPGASFGLIVVSSMSGDPLLADWMTAVPENVHIVGLRHQDEYSDYDIGWDTHGMPIGEVRDVQDVVDFYGGFRGAHRLVRTDPAVDHGQAHQMTRWEDMREAHMYLACKAAFG